MMTISNALSLAAKQFSQSPTPRLDAEVLLAHALNVARSYLHAWPERALSADEEQAYYALVERKRRGEPIAYITGSREFWSRDFIVSKDTLIPRPETEVLVEKILEKFQTHTGVLSVADLGTGCGAIALTIALEKPLWQVAATELSDTAMAVAKSNAERHHVKNVSFYLGDWCAALPRLRFDAIMANPPYIAKGDSELNQDVIEFEPHAAIFADEAGLKALRQIVFQAKNHLKSGGYLMVEQGYSQAQAVREIFLNAGYTEIEMHKDFSGQDRMTAARFFADIAS
jgi:release factor glutamine methyltransferase